MESTKLRRPLTACRRLSCLGRNTDGTSMLETVIAFPVLLLFIMVIMEVCLLANAKQLANYAAFCAARTAACYGVTSTTNTHLAAALAMSAIAPPTVSNSSAVLSAFGLSNPNQTVGTICSISGFQGDSAAWLGRLASAFIRTSQPNCTVGTAPGKTHKYVSVDVTYIYRCSFTPFGKLWGHTGLNSYIATLQGLPFYTTIQSSVTQISNTWQWNVPVHGHAVTDYWAG
ncbi:MAG TPA: TadE family protein [bacterium]|nr:TadE family protein [bacterium]